jgi:hypothetical protein
MAELRSNISENFVVQQFNKSLTDNKISLTAAAMYPLWAVEMSPR